MDNASQALLIAGGIFLAILTITALVVMFNNNITIQSAQKDKEELQRLAKWNEEWQAYNKSYLYATEVYTVLKKAEQNNSEYAEHKYWVNVTVKNCHGIDYDNPIKYIKENYIDKKITKIMKCTQMEDTNHTGRIDTICFEEKD